MLKSLSRSNPGLSCGNLCSLGLVAVLAFCLPAFYWVSSQEVLGEDGNTAGKTESEVGGDSARAETEDSREVNLFSPGHRDAKIVEYLPQPTETEQRILDALEEKTELQFTDVPLGNVIEYLAGEHGINIIIDKAALEDEGGTPDTPVNLVLSGIRLESALRILLKPLKLTFVVQDEVMKITTEVSAEDTFLIRSYPVHDLCRDTDESKELMSLIVETFHATPWIESDGIGGTIAYSQSANSLVITQTFEGHRKILHLLRDLRELQRQQTRK